MAAAAQCTGQDNCATSGSTCSPWLSGELACEEADAGHFLLNGVVQPCSAVAGAASVTCAEEGNSRATCSTGYQKTDNTDDAASDTSSIAPAPLFTRGGGNGMTLLSLAARQPVVARPQSQPMDLTIPAGTELPLVAGNPESTQRL